MDNFGRILMLLVCISLFILNLAIWWQDVSNVFNGLVACGCAWAAFYWGDRLK